MRRLNPVSWFVPTLRAPDGVRHIIPHRDGAPLCDAPQDGAQTAPRGYLKSDLCPRCANRHALKSLRAAGFTVEWEE